MNDMIKARMLGAAILLIIALLLLSLLLRGRGELVTQSPSGEWLAVPDDEQGGERRRWRGGFSDTPSTTPGLAAAVTALPAATAVPGAAQLAQPTARPQLARLPSATPKPRPAAATPKPTRRPVATAVAAQPKGDWAVQLASFGEHERAAGYVQTLRKQGVSADIVSATVKGKRWHRVRLLGFSSRAQADAAKQKLPSKLRGKAAVVSTR